MSLDPFILEPTYFRWDFADGVGTITLDRPERKNPLTFDSYAELRDLFRALGATPEVKAIVLAGAGGNFCSGGDVHEIIGPLTHMDLEGLREFTRMTGDLVRADARLPAADRRRGRRRVRRRRGDPRHGQRPPACKRRCQDRLPVHPRRPVGRRHGGVRHIAADHRPRPRRRIAVHRPQHERGGRACLGLLQPHRRRREEGSAGASQAARERPGARPLCDQAPARRRMGGADRNRARHGSRGAGAADDDATISSAPTKPSPTRRSPSSRAIDG